MNSINIFGRLVRDPELKTYTNAKGETSSLCNFSVAVNRKFGEETDFFSCTVFGKRAEVINKFFAKGSRIAVHGSMQCSKSENKYFWNLMVDDFTFVDTKNEAKAPAESPKDTFEAIDDDVPF